jgi:hypothetical protein
MPDRRLDLRREIALSDKTPFETVSENLKVKKVELGLEGWLFLVACMSFDFW